MPCAQAVEASIAPTHFLMLEGREVRAMLLQVCLEGLPVLQLPQPPQGNSQVIRLQETGIVDDVSSQTKPQGQ